MMKKEYEALGKIPGQLINWKMMASPQEIAEGAANAGPIGVEVGKKLAAKFQK